MRTQLVLLLLAVLGACSVAGYKGFDCGQGEGGRLAALTPGLLLLPSQQFFQRSQGFF
jgi:hypothetical protein